MPSWDGDLDGYRCHRCARVLDEETTVTLTLHDDGVVPVCERCWRRIRARDAAANSVEPTVVDGTLRW